MRAVMGLILGLPLLVMACSGPEPEQPEPCEPSVCMDATLDGATCVVTPVAAGAVCDDEDLSTRDDACDGAGSCAGVPYVCDPGLCEDDSTPNGVDCDVVFSESGVVCDDGDVATRDDACDGGGACLGTPYACEPMMCELTSTPNGVDCDVVFEEAGAPCDDGFPETVGDVCDGEGWCEGIERPMDYTQFTHVTDAEALEAAIADGSETWFYLDHSPRSYVIDNPITIDLAGRHWAIHGGALASTLIQPANPEEDLFIISGEGSINFTGLTLGQYPSSSIDKTCLHALDDGEKRIEANHVHQLGCRVVVESPGEVVFQGYEITPRSNRLPVEVNVHEAFIVDHPEADVTFLAVETTTGDAPLAGDMDCGVEGEDCARWRQRQGRIRVINGSLQSQYGPGFFRFDSTSALGPHVIVASRSEGANSYEDPPTSRPHRLAYVSEGAEVDLAILGVSEAQNTAASGCSLVDWNGSGGRLWLAAITNDCAGGSLVTGDASGGRIQAILGANDDAGEGFFPVTGADVYAAHNIVGEAGSRGWRDATARMADWDEPWDLPALDWPDALLRPDVTEPLPGMINVADYGAIPDDGEDDAEAFQEVLDLFCSPSLAVGEPAMIYCPDGDYNIDSRSLVYNHETYGSACPRRPRGGWFAGSACRLIRDAEARDAVFRFGGAGAFFQGWQFVTHPFDETEEDPINEPAFSTEALGAYAPQNTQFQDCVFDGGIAGALFGGALDGNNSEFLAVQSTFQNARCGFCSGNSNALNNMAMDSTFIDNVVHMGSLQVFDLVTGAMLSNGGGKVNGSLRATLSGSRAQDFESGARYGYYHHGLVSDGARLYEMALGWTSGVSVRVYDASTFTGLGPGTVHLDNPVGGDVFIDSELNRFDPTLRDHTQATLALFSDTPEAYRGTVMGDSDTGPRIEHVPAYVMPAPHVVLGLAMNQYGLRPGDGSTAILEVWGDATGDVEVWIDCDDGAGEGAYGVYSPDSSSRITIPDACTYPEPGAYRLRVRVQRQGMEDEDVQLLRVEPRLLTLEVSPTDGEVGTYAGSAIDATVDNSEDGAFDALYYCQKSCDGGARDYLGCGDDSECSGSRCRAQGTCSGGTRSGAECHFDTDCPRDDDTLHPVCAPDAWTFRATGQSWSAPAGACDAAYGEAGTYTPTLSLRFPSVRDGMKGTMNLRTVNAISETITISE